MSGGKHTPGPLQVVEGYEVWDTRGDGEPGIPLAKADLGLNRKWGRDIGGSEIAANLTLFAAASDLLERLIEVTVSLEAELQARYPVEAETGEGPMQRQYKRDMQEVWDARAAIAKAIEVQS